MVNETIAAPSMATLLQKNCIKTLTVNNGVVMVNAATSNGNSGGQSTSQQTGIVGTMQTHTLTGQPMTTVATSRVLLPHELGSLAVQSQPLHQTFQSQQQQQQQYIFYNNANLSNSTTTFVTQNNIPKPSSSLGAIQYNNSSGSGASGSSISSTLPTLYLAASNGIATGPILMTTNKASQPKLNQIIATNTFASSPIASSINRTLFTTATTMPTIASIVAVKAEGISSSQSDGIHRNGTTSITDNNNSNYSPTSNSSTTIQTNDIKHTTSTNNSIGHGSTVESTSKASSSLASSTPPPPLPMLPPPSSSATDSLVTADDTNEEENEPEPEIDIVINNVVCSFSVRCHLNLREIALNGRNVEFRRENGMVTMKLRRPYTTASIWSSGRITCTGATSEDQVSMSKSMTAFSNSESNSFCHRLCV